MALPTRGFNPETPGVNPDQTGASHGTIADTSFASLFENVGNIAIAGVKAEDIRIQENIKEDVYDVYDTVNDQFGVNAVVAQSEAKMNDRATTGPTPQELTDKLGQLRLMQKAMNSGDLKSYHYWGRLENEVKNLRAKYPGYREQIDNIVSGITGGTPANALRNALLSEMEANAAEGSATSNKKFSYILENQEYLSPGTAAAWSADPEGMYEIARAEIQQKISVKANHEAVMADLGARAKLKENTADQAVSEGVKQMDFTSNEMFHDVGTALGKNYTEFKTKTTEYWKDGVIDTNETKLLMEMTNQLRSDYTLAVADIWSRQDSDGNSLNSLSAGKESTRDSMIAQAKGNFELIIDAAVTGKTGILNWNEAGLTAMKNSDTLGVYSREKAFRELRVIRETVGDQFWGFLANDPSGKFSALVDAIRGFSLADMFLAEPGDSMSGVVDDVVSATSDPEEQQQIMRSNLDSAVQMLLNPEAQPAQNQAAAQLLFSPENNGFLTKFSPGSKQENWIRLFSELASSTVTAKMFEMGKENPEHWENYKAWVFDKWPALFSSYATELNTTVDQTQGGISFVYNSEANEFSPAVDMAKLSIPSELGAPDLRMQIIDNAQLNISEINGVLKLLNPIWEADKTDKTKAVKTLMDSIGVKNIDYQFEGTKEPRTKDDTTSQKGDTTPDPTSDIALINMIGEAEGADYDTFSGGSNQALTTKTVAEVRSLQSRWTEVPGAVSSASGKLQIMPDTIDWLVSNGFLSDSELFDKEAQDRAAIALLNRRGYGRYKAGKLPANEFLDNLALEWASIPNSSGESAYLGVGSNDKTKGGEAIASLISGR